MIAEILDVVLIVFCAVLYVAWIAFLLWVSWYVTSIYLNDIDPFTGKLERDKRLLACSIAFLIGAAFFILIGLDVIATELGW